MSVIYNKADDVYWFDTTAELLADTEYVKKKDSQGNSL